MEDVHLKKNAAARRANRVSANPSTNAERRHVLAFESDFLGVHGSRPALLASTRT